MIIFAYTEDRVKIIARKVAELLREGKVFAIPTDTSYGLIADATNIVAVRRIFMIKKRPYLKPLSVFVSDIDFALNYIQVDSLARKILRLFPGPYTIIFKAKNSDLVKNLIVFRGTVGIRIPQFNLPRLIVRYLGRPITATSANIHGEQPIYDSQKLWSLNIDGFVDAKVLPQRPVSTIIDVSSGRYIKILRLGAVGPEELMRILKTIGIQDEYRVIV